MSVPIVANVMKDDHCRVAKARQVHGCFKQPILIWFITLSSQHGSNSPIYIPPIMQSWHWRTIWYCILKRGENQSCFKTVKNSFDTLWAYILALGDVEGTTVFKVVPYSNNTMYTWRLDWRTKNDLFVSPLGLSSWHSQWRLATHLGFLLHSYVIEYIANCCHRNKGS